MNTAFEIHIFCFSNSYQISVRLSVRLTCKTICLSAIQCDTATVMEMKEMGNANISDCGRDIRCSRPFARRVSCNPLIPPLTDVCVCFCRSDIGEQQTMKIVLDRHRKRARERVRKKCETPVAISILTDGMSEA